MRIVFLRLSLLLVALAQLTVTVSAAESAQIMVGKKATFFATIESSVPATFQWRKNGIDIPGAVGDKFTLNAASAADAGLYTVFVSNSAGSALSSPLTIAVVEAVVGALAPTINTQPSDLQVQLLGTASFQVGATGSPAPAYQWLKDGVPIPGSTSANLSLSNITLGGNYSVTVSNAGGSVTSRVASLTVLTPIVSPPPPDNGTLPVISRQPGDLQAQYGSNVVFSVSASGSPMPTLIWYKDGVAIPGANSGFLSVTNVTTSATYSVTATNTAGTVTSRAAVLTVIGQPAPPATPPSPPAPVATAPVITQQPATVQAMAATSTTLTAAASGIPEPTYQWRKNGTDIYGATNASFTLGWLSQPDAARYTVVATNSAGSAVSNEAVVSVVMAPFFTSHPTSQAVTDGSTVSLSVSAAGTPAPLLQWRRNGANLSGATSSTLQLYQVSKNDEGVYDAVAWNDFGTVTSNTASLLVQAPYVPSTPPPVTPPTDFVGPLAGVVLRANYTLNLDAGKRAIGFIIRGDGPKKVLVRASGPTLGALGAAGAASDPSVELFTGFTLVDQNDNWGGSAELMQAFSQAGATPFVSGDSRDAAMLVTLSPGAYSVTVTSADGRGGDVLLEVYEFP